MNSPKIFRTPLLWLTTLIVVSSCDVKHLPEKDASISTLSQEVCECYTKQKAGDIDSRLTPCMNALHLSQTASLPEKHSSQDSAAVVDSMNIKFSNDVNHIMQDLIISCNAFGSEFERLYDRWYPLDSTSDNTNSIKVLETKLSTASSSDTTTKTILHELIKRNIQARRLEEGLRKCQQMKNLYKNEAGAYYASAFIYQLQKKYPCAIKELQQQIAIENNNDLNLFIALMKRKSQQNKIL